MIFTSFTLKVNCALMYSARLHTNMKIKLSRKVRHESEATGVEKKRRRVNEQRTKKKRNWIVNRSNDNRMIGANNNTCTHQLHLLRFSFLFLCPLLASISFTRAPFPLLSFIGCACVALIYILQSNHWYRIRVLALANASMAFSAILNCFTNIASQVNGLFSSSPASEFDSISFGLFIYLIFSAHNTFLPAICVRSKTKSSNLHERSANKLNTFQMAPIDFESKKISPQT